MEEDRSRVVVVMPRGEIDNCMMIDLLCFAGDERTKMRSRKRRRSDSDIKMKQHEVASASQVSFEEDGNLSAQGRKQRPAS